MSGKSKALPCDVANISLARIWKSKAFLLLLFLLMCQTGSAGLLVSISPKDPGLEKMSLYPNETGDYEITVLNNGPEDAKNVVVKATASGGLRIVEQGVEKSVTGASIESIRPGEKEILPLKLKPSQLSAQDLSIYIDYGLGDYTHLIATSLEVKESPLQIDASLSHAALDVGGEGSIGLSLRNKSQSAINNIKAELLVFQGLESMDGTVELSSLAPGEGYEAKEFVFRADPSATGKHPLVLQISFEDALGKHVIEKGFSVEIQSRQTILYLIIAIIILLVFIAIISRRGEPKAVRKLEKPLVQEIEGTKVKPAEK